MKELIAIQQELKAPKNQYNKFGEYNYRSAEDILEAVKPLLKKYECYQITSEEVKEIAGSPVIFSTSKIVSKEGISESATGSAGVEKASKMNLPQAYGASSSYAKKYSLGNLYLLDDTKDADATNDHGKSEKKEYAKITEDKKSNEIICENAGCTNVLTLSTATYSKKVFGKQLCYQHQQEQKKGKK